MIKQDNKVFHISNNNDYEWIHWIQMIFHLFRKWSPRYYWRQLLNISYDQKFCIYQKLQEWPIFPNNVIVHIHMIITGYFLIHFSLWLNKVQFGRTVFLYILRGRVTKNLIICLFLVIGWPTSNAYVVFCSNTFKDITCSRHFIIYLDKTS